MREKKFTRIAAFVLCLGTLLGNVTVAASAAESADTESGSGSSVDVSSDELRELLNAITYQEYQKKYPSVQSAKEEVEVKIETYDVTVGTKLEAEALKALEDDIAALKKLSESGKITDTEKKELAELETKLKESFYMTTRGDDNAACIYTPQNGSVSWTVDIPESAMPGGKSEAKFAIRIEYYPDANRSTSIERILKINDKVPFAEARFLTLPKRWVNNYVEAVLNPGKGTTAAELAEAAKAAGYGKVEVKNEDGKDRVYIGFPDYFTSEMTAFAKKYDVRFFQRDITNNEIRPTTKDEAEWMTYYLKDSTGYTTENFEFVLEKGENTITLESRNEPMSIKSITLYPLGDIESYESYSKRYEGTDPGSDIIMIEGEFAHVMSNKTIYAVEDRSCAINSPTDATCSLLNTIGGEKWATAGQWVEYRFKVNTAGMYDIVSRFRQNVLDGMYTCRSMFIFSEGLEAGANGYYNGAPFAEALNLTYDYSDDWQVTQMATSEVRDTNNNGKIDKKDKKVTDEYSIYLAADTVYTIRFEVTLGKMGEIVREVEDVLTTVNNGYLEIIKLTGITPDKYRDYGFSQVMPDVMVSLVRSGNRLKELAVQLTTIAGEKSSNVATLEKVARLLIEMGQDDDKVAKNLDNLKSYIGTLGTFLSDVRTQPLQLDYIKIQPAGAKEPKATPGFFQSLWHEIVGFFQSFFRDYNSMGALEKTGADATEVWLATARDQSQVIRNLVNNDFTPNTNIAVDLKLVAAGTLLPSILAGEGPDVYLGLAQGDVINYAIRSALINIENLEEDFDAYWRANFTEAAMEVLKIEDADQQMHYYGLPESQSFPMMFVRIDVLADLDLSVPKTWDDIMACIPTLQANNMQIGLPTDYRIFLYQQNGDLFADDGMRINLDSKLGLASFEKMCNLFTMYSFPYQYDAANRFRTGEMPILLGDYTGTYNQLKVFATEIEGKWEFMPLPGERQADGSINNVSISAVSATVMVKGCDNTKSDPTKRDRAWEFMKWYNGEKFQVDFSNEMVAILGPSAKQAVSNKNALSSLPWTTSEYEKVQAQFNNLGSVPNYPGAYIIDRYTNFAFLSAYNDNANPSDALMSHIPAINKEIERKRNEFNLEVLGDYKDLLTKRLAQIDELAGYVEHKYNEAKDAYEDIPHDGRIQKNAQYSEQYEALMLQVQAAARSDDAAELKVAADAVRAAYEALDPDGTKFIADRNKVMGYDMTDTSLSKADKKKVRKCFSYEVYMNTSELYTQLKCLADFLDKAAALTPEN